MSKCTDLSIEFRSTNKYVLETLCPQLTEFFEYDDCNNYREWYKILMGANDPKTGKRITDKRLAELMDCVCSRMDVDDDIVERGEYFHLSIGDSGFTDSAFWILVADKYKLDFEIVGVSGEREWDADETVYINGELNYLSVELDDDEIVTLIKNECADGKMQVLDYINGEWVEFEKDITILSDEEILEYENDFRDYIIEGLYDEIEKQRTYSTFDFTYTPPVVLIDCENNYLDNLKSFVYSNKDMSKLDEHLVKSGLFKTTIGTEKRRRIEVEINGVKLYADSKHGVKQRKLNVEKLKKLIS